MSYPTAAEDSTIHHKYGVTHDVSNVSILDLLSKMQLVAPQDTVAQHSTLFMDAFPRRLDRTDFKKAGAASWGKPRVVLPKVHCTYWESVFWNAYQLMDARFVFLVGGWPQDLFQQWLDSHLLIADQVQLPWAPEGRPACYFERTSEGALKRIIFLVPHSEAYRRRRNRDERNPSAQIHSVAFRERFFDLVDIYLNDDVTRPAFLSSAKVFRCTAASLSIMPTTFRQKDNDTLATLLSRPGLPRIRLEEHLKVNLGLDKDYVLSIWDKVHTVPSSGPAFWASQEAVDQFGPVATIFKRVMKGLIQKSSSRTRKNDKRREQDPSRHEKNCNECGEKRFLCMRGPNGGRSLCLDCGRAWLRQQRLSGSKRCTGCGTGWEVSKVWLTGSVGKNTNCKNCYTRWNEHEKAVAYAGKESRATRRM